MSRKLLLALALALMMVVSSGLWRAQGAPLEGMEDDEKAARAAEAAEAAKSTPKQADQGAAAAGGAASAAKAPRPRTRRQFVKPNNWYMEIGVVAFTVVYGLMALAGRRKNEALARSFFEAIGGGSASMLARNFAHLGMGDPVEGGGDKRIGYSKDGPAQFTLYASGRRFCSSLLADVSLAPRQDLLGSLWGLVSPADDRVTFEVTMNDAAMPPVVLVIAGNKLAKSKFADLKDVSAFAKPVAVSAAKLPHFPSTKLTVLAESGTMFYDLLAADPKIGQIFQADGPLRPAYRRFKSLYISSEHVPAASAAAAGAAAAPAAAAGGGEGKVCTVQLTFSLPPAAAGGGGFDEVAPLVQLVPLIIDFLGTYELTPEQRRKAQERRLEAAAAALKETEAERREALAAKKAERLLAEKAKLLRMDPEKRQRYEDKKRADEYKKAMRKRTVKM